MDSSYYRRPQHPRHGMYHPSTPYVDIQNQSDSMTYTQCHPNYNENSPWVMWQDRTSTPVVSLKKGKRCSAVLGIAVFLAILSVMGIAGLAIYMGALKLDSAQYLVFDGSLRVTSGDAYNPSMSDHSSELYKKKFQFYKMLLQTVFKKSELGAALKHTTITGFAKGSLIVFFRLILDRRKVPKPLTNLEERARIIILQEFNSLIPSLPLQNLKIDQNQVYIKRHFENSNKGSERGEIENSEKNISFQIKNGVLLKTPLISQSPKYKSTTQSEHLVTSKPKKTEFGFAQGSFVISSSESPVIDNISTERPKYTNQQTTHTPTSSSTRITQSKKNKPSSSFNSQLDPISTTETLANTFQHSPALNALLMYKQTTQKPIETTQQNKATLESDLITLLPYIFPSAEEPWKPLLPENFTRYPQRRPTTTTTEDYSSEGVGVVEVVLDPDDIDEVYSKVPLNKQEQTTVKIKKEYLNLHNPLGDSRLNSSSGLRNSPTMVYEKSIFGPRSNDKVSSFALHIDSTDSITSKELETSIFHTSGGDIVRRLENLPENIYLPDYNNKDTESKTSTLSQYFPEFPIVQEFHNLDTLLRSYNIRSPSSKNNVQNDVTEDKRTTNYFIENTTADIPITLLPVRSNSGIGKPLRPRPTVGSTNIGLKKQYFKISSSLTPDTEQLDPNVPENDSNLRTYIDLQSNPPFAQDDIFSSTTDYTSSTNYFDSFFATITPTDFEDKSKYNSRVIETSKENNIEETTSIDYETESTDVTSKESKFVVSTNIPHFKKERTLDQQVLHLTIAPLNEETYSTPEEDSNIEVTTNIHDKTYFSEVYRKPKMVTQYSTIVLPLKLPTVDDVLKVKEESSVYTEMSDSAMSDKNKNFATFLGLGLPINVHSIDLDISKNNHSTISGNLKDNSMEDYLEKVIFNISTETSDETITDNFKVSESTTYFPYFFTQSNDSANDTNLASNRKYEKADRNSITMDTSSLGLISNLSFPYNNFHDDRNRNLTKKSNDSLKSVIESQNILKISSQLMQSNLNNNLKEDTPSKNLFSSSNYLVNKSGFSILTKLLNKVPEQLTTATENNISVKNNHSECFGNLSLQCGSGECVSALSRCNHLVDCTDGSDEKNCSCAEFLQSQFLTRKICDGVVDCWDFSDENNCDWCVPGQYVCSNSRVCVNRDRLCDGERDCPNGDDEKNCVAITPDLPQTNTMAYISKGYLMIRKNGQWGKLCTENFDSLNYNFKSSWSMEDLGKAVCKAMTFRKFESASIINDTVFNHRSYFELSFTKGVGEGRNARMGFSFAKTNCSNKEVIHVGCSDLECGIRPQANTQWTSRRLAGSTRHSRIVGGGNAGPGSWPWQAALYKEGEFQCGATLISDRWLLSAGHCFYHALEDYWVARLGALRRGTSLPSPYEQLQPVSRIILHPGYVDVGFINDISLLEMKNPVSFTNYVRPICLPEPTMQVTDGTLCTVVGWGQLFEVGRIFPDTLQEVQLPIISTAECRKRTVFLPLYRVTENMFCAGYDRGGRDACLGDSGGPLMCQESDGRWSLVGVTSNGYGCARANRPGVYTKVSNYVNWVKMNMESANSTSTHKRNLICNGHRCPLGECLSQARICNGYMECSDGSDEKDCW